MISNPKRVVREFQVKGWLRMSLSCGFRKRVLSAGLGLLWALLAGFVGPAAAQSSSAIAVTTDPFQMHGPTALNGKIEQQIPLNVGQFAAVKIKDRTELYFVSQNGRYVMRGPVYDLWEGKELDTLDAVKVSAQSVGLKGFDAVLSQVEPMIIGDGPRRIELFVDPYCPYCKKLLEQVPEALATKRFTFVILPIPLLGDRSTTEVRELGCAADQKAALQELLAHIYDPPLAQVPKCDVVPMEKRFVLAKMLNISAVPFIVKDDGTEQAGLPDEDFLTWLGE